MKAQVLDSPGTRSYRVKTETDRVWRRNRNFLIKTPENFRVARGYEDLQVPFSESTNNNSTSVRDNSKITVNQGINNSLDNDTNIGQNMNQSCNDDNLNNVVDKGHENSKSGENVLKNSRESNINENNTNVSDSNNQITQTHKSIRVKQTPTWTKDYQMSKYKPN